MRRKDLISIAILVIMVAILFTGSVSVVFNEADFTVKSGLSKETFAYADIKALELRQQFEVGGRKVGSSTMKSNIGTFQNEELGTYRLYGVKKTASYIIVTRNDGILVFNLDSDEATQAAYQTLLEKTGL